MIMNLSKYSSLKREWLHWLAINVEGSDLQTGMKKADLEVVVKMKPFEIDIQLHIEVPDHFAVVKCCQKN